MKSPDSSPDRETLLLPFLVNGTLEKDELLQARELVRRSESARDEASFLEFVRTSLKESGAAEGPTDLEREQILRRITSDRPANRNLWPQVAPWALAAALLLSVIQAAIIWKLASAPADRGAAVRDASGEAVYRPAGAERTAQFAVQFTDTATALQIRELLLARGLTVVEGPSAIGVYGLVIADPDASGPTPQELLAVLQAEEIIRYASLR